MLLFWRRHTQGGGAQITDTLTPFTVSSLSMTVMSWSLLKLLNSSAREDTGDFVKVRASWIRVLLSQVFYRE